jgi:hypothetical protein
MPPYVGFRNSGSRGQGGGTEAQQSYNNAGKRLSACGSSRHLTARRGIGSSQVQITPSVYRCMCHSSQTIHLPEVSSGQHMWESPQFETQTAARAEFVGRGPGIMLQVAAAIGRIANSGPHCGKPKTGPAPPWSESAPPAQAHASHGSDVRPDVRSGTAPPGL